MRGRRSKAITAAAAAASGPPAPVSGVVLRQLQSLRDAAAAVRQSGGRLPRPWLSRAFKAVTTLHSELIGLDGDGRAPLLQMVWGTAENRAALLTLLLCVTHDLSAPPAAPTEPQDSSRERVQTLHSVMLGLLIELIDPAYEENKRCSVPAASRHRQPPPPLSNACLATVELLLRMDFPRATSALLVAAERYEGRSGLPPANQVLIAYVASRLLRWCFETYVTKAAACGQMTASVLEAFVDSGLVEHCARALLLLSTDPPARAPIPTPPSPSADCSDLTGARGPALGLLLCSFGGILCEMGDVGQGIAPSAGRGGGSARQQVSHAVRAVLSGPNLQYALAAHAVSQLAAADGGTVYGMDAAAHGVLEVWTKQADVGRGGSGGQAHTVLADSGISSALRCWTLGLDLDPPVRLFPYGPRAVHELSLRVLRLVAASAAMWAPRRPPPSQPQPQSQIPQQQQQQHYLHRTAAGRGEGLEARAAGAVAPTAADAVLQQVPAGGSEGPAELPPPAIPLDAFDCKVLVGAALRCTKTLARATAGPLQGVVGVAAAAAGAVEGRISAAAAQRRQTWQAAVPAVHGVIDLAEAGLCAGGPFTLDLFKTLHIDVPIWPVGDLPPAPPPELALALAAGYVPLLERAVRVQQRLAHTDDSTNPWATAFSWLGLLHGEWPRFGRLLAYGEPLEVASLLSTGTKLMRKMMRCGGESGGKSGGGASTGSSSSSSGSGGGGSASSDGVPLFGSGGEALGANRLIQAFEQMPLNAMFRWLAQFATMRQAAVEAAAADGDPGEVLPAWVQSAAVGAGAAAELPLLVTRAALLAAGVELPGEKGGPAAAAPADGDEAVLPPPPLPQPLQWAAAPTQQLLHMLWRATRQWLPLAARAALALLQHPQTSDPIRALRVLGLVNTLMPWVAAIAHAYVKAVEKGAVGEGSGCRGDGGGVPPGVARCQLRDRPQTALPPPPPPPIHQVRPGPPPEAGNGTDTGGSGSGSGQAGSGQTGTGRQAVTVSAEDWWQLLLVDMRAGSLLEWALRWMREALEAGGGGGDVDRAAGQLHQIYLDTVLLHAYTCLEAIAHRSGGGGDFVAAALPPSPYDAELSALLSVLEARARTHPEEGWQPTLLAVRQARRRAAEARAEREAGGVLQLPEIMFRRQLGGVTTAGEVAALLRVAASLPAPGSAAVLPSCSNPDCTNLEGPSEAALQLRPCRRCGAVSYCGSACQWAHWQRHHRHVCGAAPGLVGR